jgi:hypothetical protein
MPDPATAIQPTWLATLPIWLQHRDKVPHYSGLRAPKTRAGDLDTPDDRKRLVAFPDLRLGQGFEPGYALGPVGDKVLCGVDFDHCFGHDGKVIEPLRMFCTVAREAGALIEVSRSGHGLHVVWLAVPEHLPPTFKRPGIECYTGRRFFAWGQRVVSAGAPTPIDMRPAFVHLPQAERAPVERGRRRIQEGGRDNYLWERRVHLQAAGTPESTLLDVLRAINDEDCDPPLPDDDVQRIARGGGSTTQPRTTATEVFGPVDASVDTSTLPSLARPLRDGADFDYDVVYHLIDSVLPVGGLTMLWGESTAGKSFLALDWCLHLVYGRAWHGRKVRPSRVWYMAGEGEVGLKKRVVAWRKFHDIAEPTGDRFLIHNLQHVTAFESLDVDRYSVPPCDLIVIDTLNRWSQGNENDAAEMGEWLRTVQKLAVKAGNAAILIVHHARKDGDQYRGSTAIKAAVDAEFEIAGDTRGVTITHLKSKDEEMLQPMRLTKRVIELGEKDDGFGGTKAHTSLVFEGGTEDRDVNASLEQRIIEALRQCGGEVSSRNGLLQLVRGMREPTLACVRSMVARGVLEEKGPYGLKLKVFDPVVDTSDPVFD